MRNVGRAKLVAVHALAGSLFATAACGLDWTVPEQLGSPPATDGSGGASVSTGGLAGAGGDPNSPGDGASVASSSTGAGAASSAGSGGAASACDVGSCEDCDECAAANDCAATLQACGDDPPCSALSPSCCAEIDDCIYGDTESWQCGGNLADADCIEACYDWIYYFAASVELHKQLMRCILCDTCTTTCAAYQPADWLGGC